MSKSNILSKLVTGITFWGIVTWGWTRSTSPFQFHSTILIRLTICHRHLQRKSRLCTIIFLGNSKILHSIPNYAGKYSTYQNGRMFFFKLAFFKFINEEIQSGKFEKNTYSLNFPCPDYFGFHPSPQNILRKSYCNNTYHKTFLSCFFSTTNVFCNSNTFVYRMLLTL